MEKVSLTYVGRFTTDKNNVPLVSKKTGKPYTSLRIKTKEYGDAYLSGFEGFSTKDWKEGDVVEIIVEKKGEYLNFSVPKMEQVNNDRLTVLENKITSLTLTVNRVVVALQEKGVLEKPVEKVTGTDVPYPPSTGPTAFDEAPEFTDEDFPTF